MKKCIKKFTWAYFKYIHIYIYIYEDKKYILALFFIYYNCIED